MSFVGLVTRKEEDTGVTLLAKVVTPNKQRSAKKTFKVKVKANSLDDYSCCVIDHATAKSKIENSQDLDNLISDISLPYNGVNGTSISYKVVNTGSKFPLSDYLAEDGKLLGRPKFEPDSSGVASGYLEISVTKGNAIVQSRILITIKSITADEILAREDLFNDNILWQRIRGANDSTFVKGNEWSGNNNIHSSLSLIKEIDASDLSTTKVSIAWEVNDTIKDTIDGEDGFGESPRIDISNGSIIRPSYKSACTLVGKHSNVKVIGDSSSSTSVQNRRVRIGGITLTATLSLGEAKKVITFDCSTLSKYITNKEIMDVVEKNLFVQKPNGQTIKYKQQYDSSYEDIVATSSGGKYKLKALGNTASMDLFEDSELYLSIGQISGVSFNHTLKTGDGNNTYDIIVAAQVFGSGFKVDEELGETYSVLEIDFDAMKDQSPENHSFSISTNVAVTGYSGDGITLGGAPQYLDRYMQIKVNTDAITED